MSSNSFKIGELKKGVRFKLAALENFEKVRDFGQEKGQLASLDGAVNTEIMNWNGVTKQLQDAQIG